MTTRIEFMSKWISTLAAGRVRVYLAAAALLLAAQQPVPALASCGRGRVVLKAPVPDQIFVAGVNELRKVPVLVQGRDETVRTCGLWAVTKVPGVTIDAYGATSDYEVGHLPVGYPPVRKDILVSVSSTAPVGDGVIELRNKLDTGADTGPLEDLVVGTIGVHIGRPPVLLGHGWRTSQMFSVDTRDRVYSYGTREFGFCPSTYKRVGSWAYSPIGYWLCARDDLAKRRFGVGVVESWVRVLFDAWGGATQDVVWEAPWNTCPPRTTLLGQRYASDGLWVCMQPAERVLPPPFPW